MGIYYSVLTGSHGEAQQKIYSALHTSIDFPQSILYLFSIVISLYIFAISKLSEFYEDYNHLDPPFHTKEDKSVLELGKAASQPSVDPKGIAI